MTDPVDLLGDVGALRAADPGALLPAAATAGAQLRSTAGRAEELFHRVPGFADFDGRDGIRPRALVIVARGRAEADAQVAVALFGPRCPVPVVVAADLPSWVGALDLVVILAADRDSGGPGMAQASAVARRRGATVLVRAADSSEMAYAAASSLLSPAIGVPEALAGAGRLTVLMQVASACGLLPDRIREDEIHQLADLLDAEALACSPQVDTFINPAKGIALHLVSGAPAFIGAEPVGAALAGHAASALAEICGLTATAFTGDQIVQAPAVVTALAARPDPFADPFDELLAGDNGVVTVPQRTVVVRARAESDGGDRLGQGWYPALLSALPQAMTLDGVEMVLPLRDSGLLPDSGLRDPRFHRASAPGQPYRGSSDGPDGPDGRFGRALSPIAADWAAAALVMLRMDFAAVYAGIIAGQKIPADAPSGLGAHAGSRDLLRPDTVVMTSREQEDFDRWN